MARKPAPKKKDPHAEALQRGAEKLAKLGIAEGSLPPVTPPADFVGTVALFTGRDPDGDLVIAEWLGRISHPAAAERLAAWEASAGSKELKREIRRSLFRLEQKGIRPDRSEPERGGISFAPDAAEPEGYLSTLDGDGKRLAWLGRRDRASVVAVLTVIGDREGMISVDGGSFPRARFQQLVREVGADPAAALTAVPWRYADALMHHAFRQGAPRPGAMKADYLLTRVEITGDAPLPYPACPIIDIVPRGSFPEDEALEASAELFREGVFRSWVLPEDAARPHRQSILDAGNSSIVLSKESATERVVMILDEALEAFVAGPFRDLYVRRLEEMAYIFHRRGSAESVRRCLAVAGALRTPAGRRMKEISFLRALVFRTFAPMLAPPPGAAGEGRESETAGPSGSEYAEGSSRILDPTKVRETGVPGAGQVGDVAPAAASKLIVP